VSNDCHPGYRGIVLRESLASGELPVSLRSSVETEYQYHLDGVLPVTVIRLQVPAADLLPVVWTVALALHPERYFANFTGPEDMLVTFPNTLVRVLRIDPTTAIHARQVGALFGIPAHQMRFEAMFDADHPHTGGS